MVDREQQFALLAGQLARYEPGDLMTLSEIIDGCRALSEFYPEGSAGAEFLAKTLAWMDENFHGPVKEGFGTELGQAVELLQRWRPDLGSEAKTRVEAEMDLFHRPSETAATPPVTPDENLRLFIADGKERMTGAQELLLKLETSPQDAESLSALFRVFHTIKGECGFLRLKNLGTLTHRLENLLDLLRNGKAVLTGSMVDLLLGGIDRGRLMLRNLENGRGDAVEEADLTAFLSAVDQVKSGLQPVPGEVPVEPEAAAAAPERAEHQRSEIIRVNLDKVNFLVDMIGELTIALGQISEDSLAMAQVRKITRSLQGGAMELRTDTMQGLFSTMRRMIRDLSRSLAKRVNVHTEGESLEIDRNLIKKLEEPLMHLVRNALDHGMESPEERRARGRPETGTIQLSAVRHGSTITITVEDDGRGLDRDKILAKAIERGLISQELAGTLSDSQIHDFIFQPGFSTSDTVSQVSGRGVGLDIVRAMVSACRGTLRTRTAAGQGTTFVMTFPISTAVIDGLVVRVGPNTLIVPTSAVIESLKISVSQLSKANSAELVTIRDKIMPVLRLERVLGMDLKNQQDRALGIGSPPPRPETPFLIGMIVENSDHLPFFLVIDEILAKREVVVKPLGPRFQNMRGITSGTVLAGGTIGLVLDVDQIIHLDLHEPLRGELEEEASWK